MAVRMTNAKKRMAACVLLWAATALFSAQSPNIGNTRIFPANNPWNWDISSYQVHPNSANYIASIGASANLHPDFGTVWDGAPIGIPYVVVNANEPMVPINFTDYGDESDPGPYPIPLTAPIEGGPSSDGDRHVIAVDTSNNMLYELYSAYPRTNQWDAACGAVYDLTTNNMRPEGWTSADAAGLPIFPGLVRYEEVYINQEITHAIRFTVQNSQRAYIWPAQHYASSSTDPNRPPMGLRFRLKAGFNISGYSAPVRVILTAFKKYGLIVADNGSNWYISGAPDDRWDDDVIGELKSIAGSNFEAILTVDSNGDPIYPIAVEQRTAAKEEGVFLKVFPNPGNNSITVTIDKTAGALKAGIYDVLGRRIYSWVDKDLAFTEPVVDLFWNGTNNNGLRVKGGVYCISVKIAGKGYNKRILLLP